MGRAVLVGTDEGLWRIRGDPDAAVEWSSEPLLQTEGRSVRAVVRAGEDLLVGYGMRGSGLLRSGDGGRSWEPVADWPEDRQAWSVQPHDDGTLWVGSQPADIWHGTVDGGWERNKSLDAIAERAQWTFIRPPFEAHVLMFSRHPTDPARWLAAIEQGGVLETTDGGETWTQISPLWDTHCAMYGPEDEVIAAIASGLHVRDAGGWSDRPLVDGYATGLCRDREGTFYLYVRGGIAVLWKSGDARGWEAVPADVPEPGTGVHALAADPQLARTVYHGAEDGVWLVRNGTARPLVRGLPWVRRLIVE